MRTPPLLLSVGVLVVVACSGADDRPPAPPHASDRPVEGAPGRRRVDPGLTRHGEDGGWTPPEELLRRAAALADPAVAAEVDALSPVERVMILRAGLRLPDGPAAVACASRLRFGNLDTWECERSAELLTADRVLRDGDRERLSHAVDVMSSDDARRFLAALPPLPWGVDVDKISFVSEACRRDAVPEVLTAERHAERDVANALRTLLVNATRRIDADREALSAWWLEGVAVHADDVDAPVDGMPRLLRRLLRDRVLDLPPDVGFWKLPEWVFRWLREHPPSAESSPDELDFRLALAHRAQAGKHDWDRTLLFLQLGLARDPESDAWLRELLRDEEDPVVRIALARRGDAESLRIVADGARSDALSAAVLWEQRPDLLLATARAVVAEAALEDVVELVETLASARDAAELFGVVTEPATLSPLETVALQRGDPLVQAVVGAHVVGSSTKRLARTACEGIARAAPETACRLVLAINDAEAMPFLEAGGDDALLPALRRAALGEPADTDEVLSMLLELDDPDFPAPLLDRVLDVEFLGSTAIDSRRSPVLAAHYTELLRSATGDDVFALVERLARAQGVVPRVAWLLQRTQYDDRGLPDGCVPALLDGRPVDAIVALVEARPDEVLECVGLLRDERIATHLRSIRDRRELGLRWPAVAELALMGNAEARAEFEAALRAGFQGIERATGIVQLTQGFDPAAIRALIDELHEDCGLITADGGWEILASLFDIESPTFTSNGRVTPGMRAERLWSDAGGRFVHSRIGERLVPEPR